MTQLIDPSDPRYFKQSSDKPYDRHQYQIVINKDQSIIFDDYDQRFGCYHDIAMILDKVPSYFVYSVGKTASNNPNHQVVVRGRFP